MEHIYIVKKDLGEELCEVLGYDEMHRDEPLSLDLVFDKLYGIVNELQYEIEQLKKSR